MINDKFHLMSEEQQTQFRLRADKDFVNRSISGIILYAIFWPLFCLLTNFHKVEPQFSLWFGVAIISVSIVRYVHLSIGWKYLYHQHYTIWNCAIYLLCFMHAALWSLLFVLMVIVPSFEVITLPVLCIFAGIVCSANVTLTPKFRIAQMYMAVFCLPAVIACQFNPNFSSAWAIILLFWVYQTFTAKHFWKEYISSYVIETELQDKQTALEKANRTDSLTQLYNRSYFDASLNLQWHTALRQQSPLALLVIDIDHFKHINDKYGHPAGDKCLVHVAQVVHGVAKRATDIVCRYGGEEFVVILPDTNEKNACAMAQSIRQEIESSPFTNGEQQINITASIGVYVMQPSADNSSETLLKQADKALYLAKENGRNRVELAA